MTLKSSITGIAILSAAGLFGGCVEEEFPESQTEDDQEIESGIHEIRFSADDIESVVVGYYDDQALTVTGTEWESDLTGVYLDLGETTIVLENTEGFAQEGIELDIGVPITAFGSTSELEADESPITFAGTLQIAPEVFTGEIGAAGKRCKQISGNWCCNSWWKTYYCHRRKCKHDNGRVTYSTKRNTVWPGQGWCGGGNGPP